MPKDKPWATVKEEKTPARKTSCEDATGSPMLALGYEQTEKLEMPNDKAWATVKEEKTPVRFDVFEWV